ncbi:MAG: CtsR family transcriptional regulator [Christensenellales bacterium]
MSALSDAIERFIVELLSEANNIELQRNELAQYFGCAPSQINYVLSTRFSPEHGYIITSKRGGGGHITIARIVLTEDDLLRHLVTGGIGKTLSLNRARAIISRLRAEDAVTEREAALLLSAMGDHPAVPAAQRDRFRAETLQKMLMGLIQAMTQSDPNNN